MKNIRTCIACRNKFDKQKEKMIKFSLIDNQVVLNNDNKLFGRSCYVCNNEECITKVKKNKLLARAFKRQVNLEVYEKLNNIL